MTDPSMADHVYLKPLTTKSLIEILKEHDDIDAVLPTMGGQTALNLCIEADEKGVWEDFNVEIIGVDIDAINITEDRQQFKELMQTLIFLLLQQTQQPLSLKEKKLLKNSVSLWLFVLHLHLGEREHHLYTKQKILMNY